MADNVGYLYSDQLVLCGHREVVGFSNGRASVLVIDRGKANDVICTNHYSHKIYAATRFILGTTNTVGCLAFFSMDSQ